jgi:PAS domain S-box-containing protein
LPAWRSLSSLAWGAALISTQTRFLFEDSPAARRRLVLTLYAVVAPGFVTSLIWLGGGQIGPGPLATVVGLLLAGALWVFVRRSPGVLDWIFPVSVGPTICCGIAYATSGTTGDAYLALVGAPLACAAALFEMPVVLAALATTIATVIVSLSVQMGPGAATVSTMLLAPAAAIAGWVIHSSANQVRVARRQLQALSGRDHALLRSLPDVLVRTDRLGRILDVHVPAKDGPPSAREDLVGTSIHDLVPANVVASMRDAVTKAIESDAPRKVEYASPGPKGERYYEARLVRSGPDEVTVIRRDVTDRHRADDERRFSAALLGHMQEAVIAVDLDLNVVAWTGGSELLYGWKEVEVLGKPVARFVQPDLPDTAAAAYAASLAWRGTDHAVVRQRRKDGVPIIIDSNVAALHDAGGNLKGYLAVCRDVTMQKSAERALKESAARLRAYFESPAVGIALTSPEKGWIEVNDKICSMLGYSRDELSRMSWLEVTHPDDVAANLEVFDRLVAGEFDSYSLDKRFIRKDGTTFWALVSASCVRRQDRSVKYVVSIYNDIERRKLAEEALRDSERWLRLSQDIARIGHYVYDIQRDHWTSSATLNSIFGIDESFPRKAADWSWIIHHEDRASMGAYLGELLASGTRFDREYRVVNQATGETCWVHGLGELSRGPDGEPIQLVGTIQDVTVRRTAEIERNALQAKLALTARLAAMGTLVAGVAHEINNPLAAGIAGQSLALEAAREARKRLGGTTPLDVDAEARLLDEMIETLEDAQTAGLRIAKIVKDLSAFGRPNPSRTRVRLLDVVDQAMSWLPATVSQAATIWIEDLGAPDVLAASSQLEQVVINLISNAARAVQEGKNGEIVIRIGTSAPGMARLQVVDNGVGIPPGNLDRIFEPFFTTRPAGDGRGIGIGLAISHSIVEAHGGKLTVTSEVGKGSTFAMDLPAAPAEA